MNRSPFIVCALSAFFAACSSSSGPSIDPQRTDCSNVCEKAQECIDQNANVTKCTDDCDAKASSDNVYQAKVKNCADCVTPKACSETGSCLDDCLRIYLP